MDTENREEIECGGKMLLLVDPQLDFICGTLPVPGAEKAMDALGGFITEKGDGYNYICLTCDRHPVGHCSFRQNGGVWPAHCVESSTGAAVWPKIMEALERYADKVAILYKGERKERDEYSIMMSAEGRRLLDKIIRENGIREIDICGLAGDVCVASTLRDLKATYPWINYRVLPEYIASLDGGETVRQWVSDTEKG